MFSEAAASGNGGTAGAGEVVAIGAGDALDDTEFAQAGEVSGEGGGGARGEQWQEIGAAKAGDVEGGTLQGGKQGLFGVAEEIETSEGAAVDGTGLGDTVEGADASGLGLRRPDCLSEAGQREEQKAALIAQSRRNCHPSQNWSFPRAGQDWCRPEATIRDHPQSPGG